MRFITISELERDIIRNLSKIPKDVDLIVGVPRSGILVATMIALQLNLPMTDLESFLSGKMYSCGTTKENKEWVKSVEQAKKILIVEDSVNSGNAIKKTIGELEKSNFEKEYYILAAYVTAEGRKMVDWYFQIIDLPRLFEWNFIHHKLINKACVDIDGVLCEDPSDEENDDGEKYIKFIKNAPLKYRPTFEIGYIVSSRLEKYRCETEEWLKENNIRYKELILSQHKTGEERRLANNHGAYKAEIFKQKKDAIWFIESDANQAQEIANISGKPVFCVDNQTFYNGKYFNSVIVNVKYGLKEKVHRGIAKMLPPKIKNNIKKMIKFINESR